MSPTLNLLDVLLAVVLLGYLVFGFRRGFFNSLGSLAGFVVGAVAAFTTAPWVSAQVDPQYRVGAVLAAVLVLLVLGQVLGGLVGRALSAVTERMRLGPLNRVAGALLDVSVAALVLSLLASFVAQLGIPSVSQQIASSAVLRAIDEHTPGPVRSAVTEAREAVDGATGIRELDALLFPAQEAPEQSADGPALQEAGRSVVQVYGTAVECRQNQTGSGFPTAPGQVVTNAHVVAGVQEPVVQTRDGTVHTASVVHYDPAADLAVLSVPTLDVRPLPLGQDPAPGDLVAFMGYPLGGPFSAGSATVQGTALAPLQDGAGGGTMEIIQVAGHVQQGNSGGPLVAQDGTVAGVVFAKALEGQVGYALTLGELRAALDAAAGRTQAVVPGTCAA
ncbi:peptidase S1 [Kocuria flava]|uniref:Peptidase S1 n=1 Tax=Kocuria flava TaxID=446860 RepID=A0A0U3HZC6_9MICC|nr:MarP family serine protease [Kocuria flava]ALU40800.1 peptidase S1 [Kocuria flava]GEO90797.1 serine protease [Kocuria flava]